MNLRTRLSAQEGFSLIAVLGVMVVGMMLATAAFAAVDGDMPFARAAQDRKEAYAAAEAGLNYYQALLRRDNEFWRSCAPADAPWISDRAWDGVGDDPRVPRAIPGSDGSYTIELLPASGEPACDPDRPEETMLDPKTSTFRIRSTGFSRGIKRSIVATFRRTGFLDFLYFTDLETRDPATYDKSKQDWAQQNCAKPRGSRSSSCDEITFADRDSIAGPFHTNDNGIRVCGSPTLGRNDGVHIDDVEIGGPSATRYVPGCDGGGSANIVGRYVPPDEFHNLPMPESNDQLESLAEADYRLTGTNHLELDGDRMTVTYSNGSQKSFDLPQNGVIYDAQGASCSGIESPRTQHYRDDTGCPILYVHGHASRSLTIASAADIVVDGDITRDDDDVVLGLVASNFVRVYHPVQRDSNGCSSTLYNITIEAAILALQHSFIVDNYECGPALGNLSVKGAIAQKFRGPVGTFNTSTGRTASGYTKDYEYDDNLKQNSPPYFLNPVDAPWRVARSNEQVPAT